MVARRLVGLALSLASLCLVSIPALADIPIYWSQWTDVLNSPGRVAVDPAGSIYVTDTNNNRVRRYDFNGNPLPWDGTVPGLSGPRGIARGPDGTIYVADTGNNRVVVYTSAGGYLQVIGGPGSGEGQFDTPLGIAVDIDNYIYVADSGHHRILKFGSDGSYHGFWGSLGTGSGQFNQPQGVAAQSFDVIRWIYVTDSNNHRVQKFTGGGAYLTQWGANGSGNGQFTTPQDVAFGDDGFVYVSDTGNHRIQKFDTDGVYQGQWGSYGSGNGQFNLPLGVAVAYNNVFVADLANNRVQRFLYPLSIAASAGAGGSISPNGTVAVPRGTSQSFTISANACYHIADVVVDAVSQGAISSYTFSDVQVSHTISASFAINTFTIAASAGANGSISPGGTVPANCGASQTFTITPNSCYHVANVVVDGVSQGAISSYNFANVQAGHTISATFAINTFTITASAGANGSISPGGAVPANCGASQTFTITPNSCYHVADVVVDGVSQGAIGSYNFANIQAGHSISATFAINTFTITASAGANGSISPAGAVPVGCGANQSFTITPNAGFVANVTVDGSSLGAISSYTFSNVQANHTISATFANGGYVITASAGPNGSISPAGAVPVGSGANQTFTITPNAGYVASVTVDGSSLGGLASYTFSNVQANHAIQATFAVGSNFENGSFSDWTVQCGGWQLVDGFNGGSAIASTQLDNVLIDSTFSGGYGHYHYDVYFPDDNRADGDLLFQIVGGDGYWVLLGPDNSDNVVDRILRLSNGGYGSQASVGCAPFHLSRLTWHPIDVYRFPNGVIRVFTDNEPNPRMEAFDSSVSAAGRLAIRSVVPGVRFDNVSFDPALPADPPVPSAGSCPAWGGLLAECRVAPPQPPPPTPTGVSANGERCRVVVSWQDVAGELGYRIYRDGTLVGSVAADQVQFADLAPAGNYTYCVASFNASESDRACASGSSGAAPAFYGANGNYYEPVNAPIPWTLAKLAAETYSFLSKPGHLATIANSGENTFVAQLGGPNRWLGGYQADTSNEPSGGWAWVTGEPFSFTSWALNEPSNDLIGGERENYLEIKDAGGGWNDVVQGDPNVGYVVEYETAMPMAAPGSCTASDDSQNGVQITWSPAVGATGYRVLRNGELLVTLPSSATSHTDSPVPGTYTYCVQSVNSCGCNSGQACDAGTRLPPVFGGGGGCRGDRGQKGPAQLVMFAAKRSGGRGGEVTFSAPEGGSGMVTVHDVTGRTRRTLWAGEVAPGRPTVVDWDGDDGNGSRLPTGIYFVRFSVGTHAVSRTVLLGTR